MQNTNINWLQWFIGFNDAEGNFPAPLPPGGGGGRRRLYPQKRVLKSGDISCYNVGHSYHLSLHSRDASLIKDIQQKLDNIGVIAFFFLALKGLSLLA
jgi:hypothetical protein